MMNELVKEKDVFTEIKELKVEKHNFNTTLQRINEFSKSSPQTINLPKVKTSESRFLFFSKDHEVTGDELNDLTTKIQNNLVQFNDSIIQLVREFQDIYKTIDYLDKEYINAICLTLEGILKNHNNLHRSLVLQKKVILELDEFRDKLDKNEHVFEIDPLWDLTHKLLDSHNELIETINEHDDLLCKLEGEYEELSKQELYVSQLRQNMQDVVTDNDNTKAYVKQELFNLVNKINEVSNEQNRLYNALNIEIQKVLQQQNVLRTELESKITDLQSKNSALEGKIATLQTVAYISCALGIVGTVLGVMSKL